MKVEAATSVGAAVSEGVGVSVGVAVPVGVGLSVGVSVGVAISVGVDASVYDDCQTPWRKPKGNRTRGTRPLTFRFFAVRMRPESEPNSNNKVHSVCHPVKRGGGWLF